SGSRAATGSILGLDALASAGRRARALAATDCVSARATIPLTAGSGCDGGAGAGLAAAMAAAGVAARTSEPIGALGTATLGDDADAGGGTVCVGLVLGAGTAAKSGAL